MGSEVENYVPRLQLFKKFNNRIVITQCSQLLKFCLPNSMTKTLNIDHRGSLWLFKIIKIRKSFVNGEWTINMWGVKLEIMFWGCKFLKINKNGITITQFSQLHKFSILQFPFTNRGSCLTQKLSKSSTNPYMGSQALICGE